MAITILDENDKLALQQEMQKSVSDVVRHSEQTLTKEQKAAARLNIGAADNGDDADYQANYFAITDDGTISLKPEYRGACPSSNSAFVYAISDKGTGAVGSKNTDLPKRLTIPEVVDEIAVVSLAPGMFLCNSQVESITIPDLVTAIPDRFCDRAFQLKELHNTERIISIGDTAFQGAQFEKVKFPNLTTMIGQNAFSMCPFLVYIDIGKVTNIPLNTFASCMKLSRIKGGAGVTTVGNKAFNLTYRLNNVEFLPNLKSIGDRAFERCRLNYNWAGLTNCTFGTNATALQMNPTDVWSACTVTAAENPVPTLLSQHDHRWKNRVIGTSGKKYGSGCVFFTAMHIYCALHNLTISTVEEFEAIVNAKNPSILNNFITSQSYLKTMLEGLGLTVEYYSSGTQASLQALYDGLVAGKYAALDLNAASTHHMAMIYGVKDNKELLFADSSLTPAEYHGRGDETIKYPMLYQNCTLTTSPIWIVSL